MIDFYTARYGNGVAHIQARTDMHQAHGPSSVLQKGVEMKAALRLSLAFILIAGSVSIAHGESIMVGTWASNSNNPGFANSSLSYLGYNPTQATGPFFLNSTSTATYNLSTGDVSPWLPAIPPSQWVSKDPLSSPAGGHVDPNGYYAYQTTITNGNPYGYDYKGILQLLADDTMTVWLNGTQLVKFDSNNPNSTCSQTGDGPSCTRVWDISLDLAPGLNTLKFIDWQSNGGAMGVDAAGTLATPEPGSLLLLGTGLAGLAKFVVRKARATR